MVNAQSIIKTNQSDKKQLTGFFSQTLKYDKAATDSVIKELKDLFIFSLKDLQSLTDEGWKILFQRMPSRSDEIREEVDKLDFESSTSQGQSKRDEFEMMTDWHKFERVLFYKANMLEKLAKTGYINYEYLNKNS